jgi:hypothetical protein
MSRKRCHRRTVAPLPPRGLRPKLTDDQLRDLGLAHVINLDTLARGEADEATLWQWVGGCLTWSRVAELLKVGEDEMADQLELVATVVERFGRTGRAVFTGPEYQLAKAGVGYMDDLAAIVDRPTVTAAAEWSEARCNQWTMHPASVPSTAQRGPIGNS